ncbi:MAG: efflux RND transporter permease subunit [Verrucomicrobia bacterium]|nr:efflux RND transporter permease subunit [Verrucomicrobiota bacterium]MBI3871057.1 efflux RND transporter permease subunit [Verrucomicrobiota bacterium]
MSFAELCIRRPVFATMLNLLLVVLGLFALPQLGVDQFPNVELPIVTVTTTLPGASPEEVETSVTKPLEEIINTIQGVDELSSSSREGVSSIMVRFFLERNRDIAAQDVRDKVNTVLSRLPPGTQAPIIDKFDIDASPVLSISVSAPRDLREITYVADKVLKQSLETVTDVGAVSISGGRTRAIRVDVDIDRLLEFGLTIADVQGALESQNVEIPGGRLDQGSREVVVRTLGRMQAVQEFNEIIVANVAGHPIRLRELAKVTDGIEEPRSLARTDGQNSVTLLVRKQSGSNTVKVIESVKEKLETLRAAIPADFSTRIIRDQSRFILRSLEEINFHLIFGAVLVTITVFIFLHDGRGTVIACIAIPASLISTFGLLKAMNYTLNNSTMLGLVFAVGVVIDDAIVVLENIHRTLEEKERSPIEAAIQGVKEIALAVVATTLSLVVIFLPLAFMKGRTGLFFASYGWTVAFSIMISMFVSFTLTPMLSSRFLRRTKDPALREKKAHGGRLLRWLGDQYIQVLGWSLRHRWIVVLAALASMSSAYWLGAASKFAFLPTDDSSEFEISIQAPEGSTLSRVESLCAEIELEARKQRIDGDAIVLNTLTTIGTSGGRVGKGEGDVTQATIFCRLPELGGRWEQWRGRSRRWSQQDAMLRTRKLLMAYPDLRTSVQPVSNIGFGGGRNAELSLNLTGPDLNRLSDYADKIIDELRRHTGMADVDSSLAQRKPELQVQLDRAKASQFGLRADEVADTLRTLVGGRIVGSYRESDDQYDVWLRAEAGDRSTAEALEQITLRTATSVRPGFTTNLNARAELVQLANFVRLKEARGPNVIERFQRQRRVTINANLVDLPLSDAVNIVLDIKSRLDLPAEYQVTLTGRAKQLKETLDNFLIAFVLAMIFMYMVLAAQFEHFVQPIAILLAVPLSLPFALGWMLLIHEPFNIYAIFGLFMLFGMVKKNGILQVDYTNTLRARGVERTAAILEANRVRLRPILMTTMMLVVSMIPIALGTGPGSSGRASMAKVIIGGQVLCLLLTLLVTPVSYALFDDLGEWLQRRLGTHKSDAPEQP